VPSLFPVSAPQNDARVIQWTAGGSAGIRTAVLEILRGGARDFHDSLMGCTCWHGQDAAIIEAEKK